MHLPSLISFHQVFVYALLITSARAATPSLEERLARLEAQLQRIEARLGDTVSATEIVPVLQEVSDLSRQLGHDPKNPPSVVKVAGKEQKLSLGGFTHI